MSKLSRALKRGLMNLSATMYAERTGKKDWKYVWYDIYCGVLDTLVYSWLDPIHRVMEFIERVWAYLPVLWRDRDWDHGFLLSLMQFKLKRMKELHIRCKRHVGVEKTIKQLLICEQLLDRLSKDAYTDQAHQDHRNKWHGDKDIWDILKEKRNNPEESKEFRKIMDHGEYMYQQDVDLFCKIFKKYHRGWWD